MNWREAILLQRKQELKELLKEQEAKEALQVLEQGLKSVSSELAKAYLRLRLKNPYTIPGLLKNYSIDYLSKYLADLYAPPENPHEAKIQILADMVITLVYPEKRIDSIIPLAMPEIEKAYKAVMKDGGGWSSKSKPENRKAAALKWYQRNQPRLFFLKEIYLQDLVLYRDRGGQEKRDFITRLLINIVRDTINEELTFQKVSDNFKRNNDLINQSLKLEDL